MRDHIDRKGVERPAHLLIALEPAHGLFQVVEQLEQPQVLIIDLAVPGGELGGPKNGQVIPSEPLS
jgi:hypothetical protein